LVFLEKPVSKKTTKSQPLPSPGYLDDVIAKEKGLQEINFTIVGKMRPDALSTQINRRRV
jgi:hypothetical protein